MEAKTQEEIAELKSNIHRNEQRVKFNPGAAMLLMASSGLGLDMPKFKARKRRPGQKAVSKAEYKIGDSGGFVRKLKKVGRNEPCPCGTGKKFKRCCETVQEVSAKYNRLKGEKAGYCFTSNCFKLGADWFNTVSQKYHCEKCAGVINSSYKKRGEEPPLLKDVD